MDQNSFLILGTIKQENILLPPSSLNVSGGVSSITLTWNNNQSYTEVHIERKTSGAYAEIAIVSSSINSYEDNNVDTSNYTYRVRGYYLDEKKYTIYSNISSTSLQVE